eukprot:TRINITY_DN6320_c0_g1_i1.p1 TRINITY_DN6320_c0_g1~~TRINITY_DN6320_c0_g1_i1.p1  ORF type:complete len:437 (+),score=119.52 TRINITY_DN6320_c0_g1_i1:39-1313(+)
MSVVVTGDEVGLIKVWGCSKAGTVPQLFQWGIQSRSRAVAGMCFGDEGRRRDVIVSQIDGNLTRLRIMSNGGLKSSNLSRSALPPISGGLFTDWTGGTPKLVSCAEAATVEIRNLLNPDEFSRYPLEKDPIHACAYQAGVLAFGGKENDLKLWDAATQRITWRAKNIANTTLDLRVPVYVAAAAFTWPERQDQIVVATGYSHVRIYDTRQGRRPVHDIRAFEDEGRKTAIARHSAFAEHEVYVGDAMGQIYCMDLRKGLGTGNATCGRFKPSHTGSIRALVPHPLQPCVASSGLGRKVLVHDVKSRSLVSKAYMKQKCTALVFSSAPAFVDRYPLGTDGKVYDDVWDYLDHLKRRKVDPEAKGAPELSTATATETLAPTEELPAPPSKKMRRRRSQTPRAATATAPETDPAAKPNASVDAAVDH